MNELIQQIQAIWKGMDPGRRILTVSIMIALIATLIILVNVMGQPRYELLYGDLTQIEQDEIIG